jgi:Tfp pilus assembly protein PilF
MDPNNAQIYYSLAHLLLRKGDPNGAAVELHKTASLEEVQRAKKSAHARNVFYSGEGLKDLAMGKLAQAIRDFRNAVQCEPESADAHNLLALALAKAGEESAAIDEFRKTLQLEPGHPDAHNNLGGLLARKGDLEAALNELEYAIELRSNFAQAHYNLGVLLLRKGQERQSQVEFQKAHDLDPQLKAPQH